MLTNAERQQKHRHLTHLSVHVHIILMWFLYAFIIIKYIHKLILIALGATLEFIFLHAALPCKKVQLRIVIIRVCVGFVKFIGIV